MNIKHSLSLPAAGIVILGSRWSLVKEGLRQLFKHEEGHWTIPASRFAWTFLRSHPEFHIIAWIALWTGAGILTLHLVLQRLDIAERKYISSMALTGLAIGIVYLIGVDQTIRSNPLLEMARQSKTSVKIEYLFCGDTYGTYDTSTDTLTICNSAHDGKSTFSSRESTVRHEVWHIVQACAAAKRSGKWGGLSPVGLAYLGSHTLPQEIAGIVSEYPVDSKQIEEEAFKAETFLSDYLIQKEFYTQCSSA